MTDQDFEKGVDFTGLAQAEAADHNNLVDLASPKSDGVDSKGKGLLLVTTDVVLGTPDVPNANVTVKWKRYAWLRRPFAGNGEWILYGWHEGSVADATYLKWIRINADLTALQVEVNNALAAALNASTQIELLSDTLNAAVNTANQALNNS